jgi:hypothetical protein
MAQVVVRVWGGMGNQLFVYAAAKRLAHINQIPLKLDIVSGFKNDFYQHRYYLRHFNINAEVASSIESFAHWGGGIRQSINRNVNRKFIPFSKRSFISQNGSGFEKRLLDLSIKSNLYLEGYWQDERYFCDIEDVLRKELVVTTSHDPINVDLSHMIGECNSVCLHARRLYGLPTSEYTADELPKTSLPIEYYADAIKLISKHVTNPHFFCFGDLPEWLKDQLRIDLPITFVTHNKGDEKNYEDLWLMSLCKHFVLSNSTFCWWAAWLSDCKDKIIISPNSERLPNIVPAPKSSKGFCVSI